MIDETTGMAAIAFVGDAPWHKLGQRLMPGASIEEWTQQAGLGYDVLRAPVNFDRLLLTQAVDGALEIPTERIAMPERHVLYRSDTGAPLSVVSKDYKVVQPSQVLDFFGKLAEIGGFELETAGALSDGKRIWALAKVNDGAPIVGQDVVRPYVLLATSYDGTMATTAKFTAIRVVCNNTITMAVGSGEMAQGKSETDTEGLAVSSLVRVPHSNQFDADKVRLDLGIVANVWERWLVNTRILAERQMNMQQADIFTTTLLRSLQPKPTATRPNVVDVRKTKGFERIMSMFSGDLIGADLTGGMNRWTMLNAVTEFVDHERGKSDDTRMTSAWFGAGDGVKNRAYEMLSSNEDFMVLAAA
jgi:phage/plasmid-like protein (TIGR03299 family)